MKVLDFDELRVRSEKTAFLKTESISAGGKTFSCGVVSFEYPGSKGTRWISRDVLGPFIVKEEGVDGDDPYSFILTSYLLQPG